MNKILQVTDFHFRGFPFQEKDLKTCNLIKKMVEVEKPDFIAVTGDLVCSKEDDSYETYKNVLEFLDTLNVPMGITYGNHDSEVPEKFSRKDIHLLVDKMKNHVTKNNREVFNYEKECFYYDINEHHRLLFVDSGDYTKINMGKYDYIDFDQIKWILDNSQDVDKISHLFIHIPINEYKDAVVLDLVDGNKDEEVASPFINTGVFAHLKFNSNVKSIYCGHDHDDDFTGNYYGIYLNYGRITGYNTYGKLARGCRIIETDGMDFRTYVKNFE